jgi:hypothetical protein
MPRSSYNPTEAYENYRQHSIDLVQFAVMICYAVPALRAQIQSGASGAQQPHPDFFVHDHSTSADLLATISQYEPRLASNLLRSNFTLFEVYVKSSVREMLDFHGGEDSFMDLARRRSKRFIVSSTLEVEKYKSRLRTRGRLNRLGNHFRHLTATRALVRADYRFPSELLAHYGVKMLVYNLKKLKPSGVRDLLENGLHLELPEAEWARYKAITIMRNQLVHESHTTISILEAVKMSQDLRELAVKIDKHLVEHFFVIERYA